MKVNLSQLATLHLSKNNQVALAGSSKLNELTLKSNFNTKNPQKLSLSQLASMSQTSVVNKTQSISQQSKVNLADLAKLNLSRNNNLGKMVANSVRPSLSDLAKRNLKSKPKTSDSNSTELLQSNLNLSLALRNKCQVVERKQQPAKKTPETLFTPFHSHSTLEPNLIRKKPSALGQVVCKANPVNQTVFLKFDLQSQKDTTKVIEPFRFDTPSPDDMIKLRLRNL